MNKERDGTDIKVETGEGREGKAEVNTKGAKQHGDERREGMEENTKGAKH